MWKTGTRQQFLTPALIHLQLPVHGGKVVLKFRVEEIAINLRGKNQAIRNVKIGMVLNCKYVY